MRHKGVRTAGAVVVALLVVAGCGSDEPARAVPSTFASCHESSAGPHGAAAGSKRFGPLGAEPSIVVHLPRTHRSPTTETTYAEDTFPDVSWSRLPGATVVAASRSTTSDSATSIVTAVNDDGSVRWTRCLPGVAGVSSGEGADVVLAVVYGSPERDGQVLVLDAADGSRRDRIGADRVDATSSRWALLSRFAGDAEHLVLVDLRTMAQTPLGDAPESYGLSIDDDGDVHGGDGRMWRDGRWAPDPGRTTVAFEYEPDRLVAHGAAEWTLALAPAGLEGTEKVEDDQTVVAWVCESRGADGRCSLAIVGVDLASGRERWRRRGDALIALGGDGHVLLQHGLFEGPWVLHDMRTGRPVAGQSWADETAFQQGCCEEGRWRNAGRVGGTVVVQHDTEVRVWFAEASSHATVDVRP